MGFGRTLAQGKAAGRFHQRSFVPGAEGRYLPPIEASS
jgi:hypothetical protein